MLIVGTNSTFLQLNQCFCKFSLNILKQTETFLQIVYFEFSQHKHDLNHGEIQLFHECLPFNNLFQRQIVKHL
jgi:hypothetical protein